MKKISLRKSSLICTGLVSLLLAGCANNAGGGSGNNDNPGIPKEIVEIKIDGHLMDGNVSDSVPYSIVYNPASFISGDNKVYSKEISKLCSVFSADVYNSISFVDRKEAYSTDRKINDEYFAKLLGLTDITRVDIHPADYEDDKNDYSAAIFSHQLYRGNDGNYEIIFCAVQGTNGSAAQWSSNFDIGADTSEYEAKTGEHRDWINKAHAKGFDVPATRLDKKLQDFIASKTDSAAKKILVLTGHSRGAAISNILGAKYSKDSSYKTFAYCFATPRTTTASDYADSSYNMIFNVINSDDLVTEVPMKDPKFGFNPFGQVKAASVKESYSQAWVDFVNSGDKKLTDKYDDNWNVIGKEPKYGEYESANGEPCGQALAGVCENRDEIYKYKEELKYDKTLASEAAETKFLNVAKDATFKNFITIEKKEDKIYTVRYCPATLVQITAFLLAENFGPITEFPEVIYENDKFAECVSNVLENINLAGVRHGHATETYLLLADKLE